MKWHDQMKGVAVPILLAACLALTLSLPGDCAAFHRTILVELFSSEGCSSCPPADFLLGVLDGKVVGGAEVITLSEQVDYWNYLGWADPFSSTRFTDRQKEYETPLRRSSVYTPQFVVNGQEDPDVNSVMAALKRAAERSGPMLTADADTAGSGKLRLKISVSDADALERSGVHCYLAVVHDGIQSKVTAGENAGHLLKHHSVVDELIDVGPLAAKYGGTMETTFSARAVGNRRLVAFLQDTDSKAIVACARVSFTAPK